MYYGTGISKLARKDPIFESKRPRVVLSTISTMNSRHGLKAKGGRGDLEACFSMVVVDEAHQLKSSGTQGNELIRWLRADAVILATASIIPNSLVDADGYAVPLDRLISVRVYSADLSSRERIELVKDFSTQGKCQVLIGSFLVGGVGSDLQRQCHLVVEFDCPSSWEVSLQALGRVRRIGQLKTVVHRVNMSVEHTFHDSRIAKMLERACPGAVAKLNYTEETDQPKEQEEEKKEFELPANLYFVDGELVSQEAHEGIERGHGKLTVLALARELLALQRGKPFKIKNDDDPAENESETEGDESETEDDPNRKRWIIPSKFDLLSFTGTALNIADVDED
jgi:hypothetical protein